MSISDSPYCELSSDSHRLSIHAYSDQVLAPPSDILTDPIDDEAFGIGKGVCEAESLQFFFSYLDMTAGIRYRVNKSANFLCLDWVRHRIWDDLEDGRPFPDGEKMTDATDYTVKEMTEMLRGWGLRPCAADDDDRVSPF